MSVSTAGWDCGDKSCRFATKKGGVRTNSGCRCIEHYGDRQVELARRNLAAECDRLTAERDALQARVKDLEDQLGPRCVLADHEDRLRHHADPDGECCMATDGPWERDLRTAWERVALLERLGDQMADELRAIAGDGEVCGLCHVYADHHKGTCALADVEAWRAARI